MAANGRLARGTIGAVLIVALACAGCVQAASAALYRSPASRFGLAVYSALDRFAPVGFVEDTLTHSALARGDLDAAQHYAMRMPQSARRDDALAQIAAARGEGGQAFEYFYAADDVDALQRSVRAVAVHDVATAYALEARVRVRLIQSETHPDAVAESYFISGQLAGLLGRSHEALVNYQAALGMAPLDMTYVLATANCAMDNHDYELARTTFRGGLDVNPASGDALAGLGIVALRTGDRAEAKAYLARAEAAEPHAPMVRALKRALQ